MPRQRVSSGAVWKPVVGYSRGRVHGEVFAAVRPATAMVEVAALIDPALLVEVEVDAYVTDDSDR